MVENGIGMGRVMGDWEVFTRPFIKSEESVEGLGRRGVGGVALALFF